MRASWLLPPFVLGALLRLWNLRAQVLGDDELHLVRTALTQPLDHILVTYQKVDASIPLSALYRVLVESGVRLTELGVRMPALLSGLLLLVLAPLWADRRLGRGTAIAFAWLLAVSPGLVFYSRIARTYEPIALLAFGAAVAFESWWRSGERSTHADFEAEAGSLSRVAGEGRGGGVPKATDISDRGAPLLTSPQSQPSPSPGGGTLPPWGWGAAYVILAALAFWLHPVSAPLVLSPLVFGTAGIIGLVPRRDRVLPFLGLAAATGLAFVACLLPTFQSFREVIGSKHTEVELTQEVWAAVAQLQAGTAVPLLAALFWMGAAFGLLRLLEEEPSLGVFSGVLVAGQVAGLLWISPLGLDAPLIFHRYALVALPWVLLWVAVALGRPWWWKRWRDWDPRLQTAAAGLIVLVLVASGPLADPSWWRSSFPHHDDRLAFYVRRPQVSLPASYGQLSGEGAILEYPWIPVWRVSRAVSLYQETHRREVVMGSPEPLFGDPRLAFRNLVQGTPDGFLASRARWLVVHRDLGAEEDAIPDPLWPPRMGVGRRFREIFRSEGSAMPRRLRRAWGRPDHADDQVVVWDLDRVRGGRTIPSP